MTETNIKRSFRQAHFLGKHYTIDVLRPPKQVVLPPHNILGMEGEDTGIPCPSTTGLVFVEEVLGDGQKTHKIIIRCESASKPFPQREGWAQCKVKGITYVKYP